MRFFLPLCCSLIGLSLGAMTDEELVYGMAKLYKGMVDSSQYENQVFFFAGAMMGWHINKNRTTSVKFRVKEGLANIERAFKYKLDDQFLTYNFSDPIDMEPYYTTFYNDSLSHLYLDHMMQTYQQLLIIKWADARTEIERVILSAGSKIDMTDIPPSSGLTRYSLMADGFAFLAQLFDQSDRLASEIRMLKCKAELIDANIPNHVAEFARLQRKIVYTCLRHPKIAGRFQEILNDLKIVWLDDTDDKMRLYQCCVNTNADMGRESYHLMTQCTSSRSHARQFCTYAQLEATGPLNKTLFYQHAAELARYHNVYRHGRKSQSLQYGDITMDKPIRAIEPYEVIHELYTNFFETMNATECAKPKLDQLLANSKMDLSSSTKFQTVYEDLLDLFQSCWLWKY